MIPEILTQPAEMPTFHPLILCLLALFAACLAYCAWTDYRKGILLPNVKYWAVPAVCTLTVVICRLALPETFGQAQLPDITIAVVATVMYYITTYQRVMGGADFFGCTLCTIILCIGLGWPAFLVWVFIALVFIPFVIRTTARAKWCYKNYGAATWEAWKKSNRGVKKSYRLLPAIWAGYIGAILVYVGAWII